MAEAAIQVFAEKGYEEATMDDIAKALGVTIQPSLLRQADQVIE